MLVGRAEGHGASCLWLKLHTTLNSGIVSFFSLFFSLHFSFSSWFFHLFGELLRECRTNWIKKTGIFFKYQEKDKNRTRMRLLIIPNLVTNCMDFHCHFSSILLPFFPFDFFFPAIFGIFSWASFLHFNSHLDPFFFFFLHDCSLYLRCVSLYQCCFILFKAHGFILPAIFIVVLARSLSLTLGLLKLWIC